MPHTLYHFSLPTRYVSIALIHPSHFLSPFTSLTFTFSRVSQGVPGCQLIEIKMRSRGLIQIISNLSKWESLKQKPLPLATCYCCHDLLQFEIIWKVPTPLILISIRNFFLGHSVLLHKGSQNVLITNRHVICPFLTLPDQIIRPKILYQWRESNLQQCSVRTLQHNLVILVRNKLHKNFNTWAKTQINGRS